MKKCPDCGRPTSQCECSMSEAPMQWDTSDSPQEPQQQTQSRRPPPFPVKVKDATGKPIRLPGVTPAQVKPGLRREATPMPPRARSQTQQMVNPDAHPTGNQAPKPNPGEKFFDVNVPGVGVYRVPANDPNTASQRIADWLQDGGDKDVGSKFFDPTSLKAAPSPENEGVGAAAMGGQPQTEYESKLKEALRAMIREVVRKKAGGGGYVLYGPNKGKKKHPKPAGEFPTRLAAKRAELARFPPKDPEQLKKARTKLDKLNKDPKKRQAAELKDLTGRKSPKKAGAPARDRKKTAEAFVRLMVKDLRERLFHEDEVPGSPWDERISSLHPDAIASDRKLAGLHKNIEKASIGALGDAHKGLSKALRGMAKVNPGDIAHDPERRKTFMPVMLDCDGTEIGPVHLYIDGGHVKVEVSQDARQQIAGLEPDDARDLRGGLMSFQEDHLPKIVGAKKAWDDRDGYLDKLHGRLEKQVGGMSGVEAHLAKQLLGKGGKKR